MDLAVSFEIETDGRWIAFIEALPGVHVYGTSHDDALAKVQSLALSVLADEIANGERDPKTLMSLRFIEQVAA